MDRGHQPHQDANARRHIIGRDRYAPAAFGHRKPVIIRVGRGSVVSRIPELRPDGLRPPIHHDAAQIFDAAEGRPMRDSLRSPLVRSGDE